jgi:hypothetical protein
MTTSPLQYSSPVAEALSHLFYEGSSLLSDNSGAAARCAEAIFYNRARPVPDRTGDLTRFVHRTAFNFFHPIQTAFVAVNLIATSFSAKHLGSLLAQSRHPLLANAMYITAFFGIATAIRRYAMHVEDSYYSKTQLVSAFLQGLDAIHSLALAVLTENKMSLLIRAASSLYSLYMNTQFRWITAQTTHNFTGGDVRSVTVQLCCEGPPHNELTATVEDLRYGTLGSEVHIAGGSEDNTQRTFEKVYAIYNAFKGLLGLLQCIPEFTGRTMVIRRYMIFTDIFASTISTLLFLVEVIEAPKLSMRRVAGAMAATAAPILLALTYFWFSRAPLAPLAEGGVHAVWAVPSYEVGHRLLDLFSLCTSTGLAFVSKAPRSFSVLSIAAQVVALLSNISVRWLRIDQSISGGMINIDFSTYAILSAPIARSNEGIRRAIAYVAYVQRDIVKKSGIYDFFTRPTHFRNVCFLYKTEIVSDVRSYLTLPFIWTWEGLTGFATYNRRSFITFKVYTTSRLGL